MYSLLTRQLFLHITHEMCFFFTRDWFFLSFNGEMSCVPHYLIIYGTLWLTGFNWKVISNWIWLYLILWSTMRTFLAFYRSSKFRFLGVSSILLKLKRVVRNHLAPSLFSKTANRANSFVNHLQKIVLKFWLEISLRDVFHLKFPPFYLRQEFWHGRESRKAWNGCSNFQNNFHLSRSSVPPTIFQWTESKSRVPFYTSQPDFPEFFCHGNQPTWQFHKCLSRWTRRCPIMIRDLKQISL